MQRPACWSMEFLARASRQSASLLKNSARFILRSYVVSYQVQTRLFFGPSQLLLLKSYTHVQLV